MTRSLPIASIWLCLALLISPLCGDEKKEPPKGDKWEKEIAAIEAKDKESPPPKGGIVFVGSSSIRMWDLKKSFPDLPVINRGIGGSQLADSVRHFDRLVLPHRPKTVVLYAGDNDLASGKKPRQVADDFGAFVRKVRSSLPESRLIFIAIKPSTARWKLIDEQRQCNRLIREQCEQDKFCTFLDVEAPMLDAEGRVRADLFQKDGLHLNSEGYKIWEDRLRPLLKD